jgi:hypothetical protein
VNHFPAKPRLVRVALPLDRKNRQPVLLQVEQLEDRCLPTVNVGTNFVGMNFSDSGGHVPPDTIAASGPQFILEAVNLTLSVYDKNTGARVSQQTLKNLFSPLGDVQEMTDPAVAYDELRGRFVLGVLDFDNTSKSRYDFAVSNSSDPAAGFSVRRYDLNDGVGGFDLADFPRLGWNADAYVASFNMFAGGSTYDHVNTLSIDKQTLTGFRVMVPGGTQHFTMAPATMHGSSPGGPMYFVDTTAQAIHGGSQVEVVAMTNLLSNTPTFTDFPMAVSPFGSPPAAKQPSGGAVGTKPISTNDTRILNAEWRNNRLVAAQTVGTGGVAHARFYEFATSSTPSLTQQGEVNRGSGVYTYFPSVAIAANGVIGMTFMESSVNEFMSMYVTGHTFIDAPGGLATPVLVKPGEAGYSTTFHEVPDLRAGDFSGITVDPVTGTSFWAANEYATSPEPNNWGTWIANFTVTGAFFAIGGVPGIVQILRSTDNSVAAEFAPYGPNYTDGVNVAIGDVNGDGFPDLITGTADGNPNVKVYDGKAILTGTFNPTNPDASLLASFFAYGLGFNVGVNVAAGDVLHDGFADIITGASAGNPDVRVFSGKDIAAGTFDPNGASLLAQWFPYALEFNVGATVAAGDVEHDGYADIVTGASAGNPDVRVYSGKDIANHDFQPDGTSLLAQFFPYDLGLGIGAFVAVGDTNGDGYADIITGATAGSSDVRVYSGKDIANHVFDGGNPQASQIDQFFAYQLEFGVGATVAAADIEGNGHFDILTGAAQGAPNYRIVRGNSTGIEPAAVNGLEGIAADLQGGIAVGA